MIKIPLDTFSYRSQSGSIIGPELIRHSKWNKDGNESELTKFIDKEARTVFAVFRCGATQDLLGTLWLGRVSPPQVGLPY